MWKQQLYLSKLKAKLIDKIHKLVREELNLNTIMKSIEFPKMFNSNSTRLVEDLAATKQNLKTLLYSEKGELFGDPYFGIRLKNYGVTD